jgi:tetratricopeptide (TPR) repeat protein
MGEARNRRKAFFSGRLGWLRAVLLLALLGLGGLPFAAASCGEPAARSQPLQARLELAAGEVRVEQGGATVPVHSGHALLAAARVATGKGARALVRLSNGAALFLRGDTRIELESGAVRLHEGEAWVDAPDSEREAPTLKVGEVTVFGVDAGLDLKAVPGGVLVYVARGLVTVAAPGGRVEVRAGEQALIDGPAAPAVSPVAFWEDWTGGMADNRVAGGLSGAGAGRLYGVDLHDRGGAPARPLELSRQAIRAVIRDGLAETEVDQTFFNPGERQVEGWYWFAVPGDAVVTGFAVETDGTLVEGEFIERRAAAAEYGRAVSSGHEPALLEWVDSRTFRARIFPVPATGTRRVVMRYLQMLPVVSGTFRYLYPLQSPQPTRIGEFSLSVDLGEAGASLSLTTLADALVEDGGRRVSMRRSGYVPRADFLLEARSDERPAPVRAARFRSGGEAADYVLVRYTPDFEGAKLGAGRGEVVVVVDTSAGADEASRSLKATAAESILRALADEDRFALVALDVAPVVLYPAEGLAPATEQDIGAALERLAEHASGGATDLGSLFDVALGRLHGAEQPAVVYVGDGQATSGELSGEALVERLRRSLSSSRARLFSVGVGPHAERALLAALAAQGGGQAFQIDEAEAASERALALVAALKTPTMTDFEIDLGAALDEVIVSAQGKVQQGEEVLVLARTHHRLPGQVKVRGRVGGQAFQREYSVSSDIGPATGLVPKLWAAAHLGRLLGQAADPDEVRGRVLQLGVEYGLMTPFTSILALESEAAYHQQGIPRDRSPLKGARLSALAGPEGDARLARLQRVSNAVGFGCALESREPATAQSAPAPERAKSPPSEKKHGHRTMRDFAKSEEAAPSVAQEEAEIAAAPAPARASRARLVDEADDVRVAGGLAGMGEGGSGRGLKAAKPAPREPAPELRACSDAASRPLRERVILWQKRARAARDGHALVAQYRAARAACELPDWRSEAAFLRVMQRHIQNEGDVGVVLHAFDGWPEVQQHLARLILRRAVDVRMIQAVERVLFRDRIQWVNVDLELAALPDVARRIERLRQVLARAPDDPEGVLRLVHLLASAGQTQEALILGRRLRDAGLASPFLSRELGDLLARSENPAEAVRTYSEIVEFAPESLPSRQLLGDIYLSHGWYDPAYRQYRTLTERAPEDPAFQLRLAAAAAGAGRVDEALRLERQVARATGRPGPADPRLWARLSSAARLARLLDAPPAVPGQEPGRVREGLKSKLKELQLFRGAGTLVLLTWEDLGADLTLATTKGGVAQAFGESTDAAPVGLSAMLLSPADLDQVDLEARLRSIASRRPVKLQRQDIAFDGKDFQVKVSQLELPAGKAQLAL